MELFSCTTRITLPQLWVMDLAPLEVMHALRVCF